MNVTYEAEIENLGSMEAKGLRQTVVLFRDYASFSSGMALKCY